MTCSRELGAGGSAPGPLSRVRALGTRYRRWLGRLGVGGRGRVRDEASFEVHVDQALHIVRQLPGLSVVPGGQARKAARS